MQCALLVAFRTLSNGVGRASFVNTDRIRVQAWLSVRKAKEAAEDAGVAPPASNGVWKFNKNTQAWLLRRVFSDDQVSSPLLPRR